MSSKEDPRLETLQRSLQVKFKDVSLLKRALTHRSAAAEGAAQSNERLEFLGDSIVGLVVSEQLYRLYPDNNEGELAKSKAYIVSENSLANAAMELGLQDCITVSAGEAASGGRNRRSILSDAFEAIVGAIYLDCGIVAARRMVKSALKSRVLQAEEDQHRGDYKSSLQERTQAMYRQAPTYRIVSEDGQEHDKTFSVDVTLKEKVIGAGTGKSKKEAEQAAAQDALFNLPSPPGADSKLSEVDLEIDSEV